MLGKGQTKGQRGEIALFKLTQPESDLTQTRSVRRGESPSWLFIPPRAGCTQSIHNCLLFLINHQRLLLCLQLAWGGSGQLAKAHASAEAEGGCPAPHALWGSVLSSQPCFPSTEPVGDLGRVLQFRGSDFPLCHPCVCLFLSPC